MLSEKSLQIAANNITFPLFAAHGCAGHLGIVQWYPVEEIKDLIGSLKLETQWTDNDTKLKVEGIDIDFVYLVYSPIKASGWRTHRESASMDILREGEKFQIVESSRCTVSTNLLTVVRRSLYIFDVVPN